jgi:hypothetical protein
MCACACACAQARVCGVSVIRRYMRYIHLSFSIYLLIYQEKTPQNGCNLRTVFDNRAGTSPACPEQVNAHLISHFCGTSGSAERFQKRYASWYICPWAINSPVQEPHGGAESCTTPSTPSPPPLVNCAA